jgi:hypothetical protein
VLALVVLAATTVLGCGKSKTPTSKQPGIGKKGSSSKAAASLGFPEFATKNTTRVGGADPIADAAGVAQAVFSSEVPANRPAAVVLVDKNAWQAGIAASVFMSSPTRAPALITDGSKLPGATDQALSALDPIGSKAANGAQVIRVGKTPDPAGYKTTQINGSDPYALAAAVDAFKAKASGGPSDRVVIASGEKPEYAMPAAGWAAKSGDAVLFTQRDVLPAATIAALKAHQQPKIYILGPDTVISEKVARQLRGLGQVRRIDGAGAIGTSIAFARYTDGSFGWGVADPGHGLVFASKSRPLDAAAAAPLSASGTYGPLLVVDEGQSLPAQLVQYLLDIQPGYEKDPVRGVYNHAWLIGDQKAITISDQSRIDTLLEIVPVDSSGSQSPTQ